MAEDITGIAALLNRHHKKILSTWVQGLLQDPQTRLDRISEAEIRQQGDEFLQLLAAALVKEGPQDTDGPGWDEVREFLAGICRSRAHQGFTPAETAKFVFSLKQPLFELFSRETPQPAQVLELTTTASQLLDRLGLFTVEVHLQAIQEVVNRQQAELMELSTPVVRLWEGILMVPLIGTLDSARTQVVMETMLQMIADTGSEIAIIDITGVPAVDTMVAQHLLKTVRAARLMGAECIISGIRPAIAQTVVQLGVELTGITTKATLADAIAAALRDLGFSISRRH